MRKVVNPGVVSFYERRIFRLPKMISGNVKSRLSYIFFIHKRTRNLMCKQKDQEAYYKAEKTRILFFLIISLCTMLCNQLLQRIFPIICVCRNTQSKIYNQDFQTQNLASCSFADIGVCLSPFLALSLPLCSYLLIFTSWSFVIPSVASKVRLD